MDMHTLSWMGLVNSPNSIGDETGWLAACILAAAMIGLFFFVLLMRRVRLLESRLEDLELAPDSKSRPASDTPINAFCQQLMTALQMEVPQAVSSRMSADDPARFARVLAIYTRAQRRKLVSLYNNAEALREQLQIDKPAGTRTTPTLLSGSRKPHLDSGKPTTWEHGHVGSESGTTAPLAPQSIPAIS